MGCGGALGVAAADALAAAGASVLCDGPEETLRPEAAAERLGRLDIVVHVAAPSVPVAFVDRDDARWMADLEARVLEPIRLARDAAAVMAPTGGGVFVFVGTLDATHAYAGHADASVAMGALLGLVRTLAVELASVAVRANAVLVGPLAEARAVAGADPERLARTLLRSPSKRFVTPAEAAEAIVFVAGPGAGFMTGASLRVDGGWGSLNQAPDGMRFR